MTQMIKVIQSLVRERNAQLFDDDENCDPLDGIRGQLLQHRGQHYYANADKKIFFQHERFSEIASGKSTLR